MFQEIFIHFPAQFYFQERTGASKETGDGEVYGRRRRPLGVTLGADLVPSPKIRCFFGKTMRKCGNNMEKTPRNGGFPMENH